MIFIYDYVTARHISVATYFVMTLLNATSTVNY